MRQLEEFKDKLIHLRKSKNMTQSELAEALGFPKSLISMYESGDRTPADQNKRKIADYFGLQVGFLFFDEGWHDLRTSNKATQRKG